MHPRADAAAPAKGTVAQGAGIAVPLLQEALRPELVRLWEVCLVEVDWKTSPVRIRPSVSFHVEAKGGTYSPTAAR